MNRHDTRRNFGIPARVRLLENDVDTLDDRMSVVEREAEGLATALAVLATRVGIYAAIGALIGGGIVAGIVSLIVASF